MLQRCPIAQAIFGFRHATDDQIDEHMAMHIDEGGFQYRVPISARDETINFIRHQLDKQLKRENRCVDISLFLPQEIFFSILPPTNTLPLDWNRYYTSSMTEKIVISNCFSPLSHLFGPNWEERKQPLGRTLRFDPFKKVTLSRSTFGIFRIRLHFKLYSANGNFLGGT